MTEMVLIPAGIFMMGSPDDEPERFGNEGPRRQVRVSGFYMGKYQVTQAEYKAVMGENPSKFKGANHPVEQVNWYHAVEYCNRLSQGEGLTPAYTVEGKNVEWDCGAKGYRLPTEAEWEYACRAGTAAAYHTGANITDNTGWYCENSGGKTHPVGQKPPNAWGLYDMHGNVWDWCWDWYGEYPSGAQTDPLGAHTGIYRVMRGGGWDNVARVVRCAFRIHRTPPVRSYNLGFRLVRNGA